MKAWQNDDERLPISPMESIAKSHTTEDGMRVVRVLNEEGTIWWGPPRQEEGEPEGEERHPEKMWVGEMDSEQNAEYMEVESDNGLGQDGLRPDELNDDDNKGVESKEAKRAWLRTKPPMRKANVNAEVYKPTKEEREQHEILHCPFMSWCKHCVRGRGMNSQHKKKIARKEEEYSSEVPKVSMDYFFMSKADEEAKENPIIGMVDEQTGEKYSRAAGKKGVGENGDMDWIIKDMVSELKAWGHCGGNSGHIILKCDNENSIKALRDAVGKLLGGRVIPENSPKGESQ